MKGMRFGAVVWALLAVLSLPLTAQDRGAAYAQAAEKLKAAADEDTQGWERLVYLCDRIGNRLSGSDSLDQAVLWAAEQMRQSGLRNVSLLPVAVPHWVRGQESLRMISPSEKNLPILGLGGSVATPPEGLRAEVVAVSSFDELNALPDESVKGRIVLYNVPYAGYGRTVAYRSNGASQAARKGAVAALVRSVGPISLQTPHTGALRYDDEAPRIPSAAVTIEGAEWIQRLIDSGQSVRLELRMSARMLPDALSADVMGEIPGSEKPEEVVVMGGHIDSWDVGQGAQDDGSGCIAPLQAATLMMKLGLRPKRTIRVVFWTNEENGARGGRAYAEWTAQRAETHVAAIEMDGGSERPVGFGFSLSSLSADQRSSAEAKLSFAAKLLAPIGADAISWGGGGTDISPLMRNGVPGFGLRTVGERYFHWHHTEADTVDKIDPEDFRKNVAALAILSYVLADMPESLPEFLKAP